MLALEKDTKPIGCRCRLMAPVSAWLTSPVAMARQAWWKATSEELHAVSMAMLGPRKS